MSEDFSDLCLLNSARRARQARPSVALSGLHHNRLLANLNNLTNLGESVNVIEPPFNLQTKIIFSSYHRFHCRYCHQIRLKTGVQIVGGVLAILSGVILVLFFAKLDEVVFFIGILLCTIGQQFNIAPWAITRRTLYLHQSIHPSN